MRLLLAPLALVHYVLVGWPRLVLESRAARRRLRAQPVMLQLKAR